MARVQAPGDDADSDAPGPVSVPTAGAPDDRAGASEGVLRAPSATGPAGPPASPASPAAPGPAGPTIQADPIGAWMDVDWRAHLRWVEVDGRWANVAELGDGPPLLFVHGLSGCWQNWLPQLPAFAATHRVIAVDLPGFGFSALPGEPVSIAGYGRWLDRLLDRLGISEPVAVVGNSMGGWVAAELALAAPERVERLVLVSSAGVSGEHARRQPLLTGARLLGMITAWAASRHEPFARRPGLRKIVLHFVVRHPDRLPAPLAFELMMGSGRPGLVPGLAALLGHTLKGRLDDLACPVLIVWGEDDLTVPVRDAARFQRLIPHARTVIYPDTGHVPMLERPADFNALLAEFLGGQA